MELPSPLRLLWYFLRITYVVVTNFMAIPAYITWYLLLYPLKRINPVIFWKIETVMFKGLLAFIAIWLYSGGYSIVESGDNIDALVEHKSVLLVNHQSTGDVPIVMTSMYPKCLITGNMMWIMDFIFKYTNFGWVSYFHGDFFILQGKDHKDTQLKKLENHLRQVFQASYQKWIVLFPEGGFLRKRRKRSQDFAKKNNLPVLQHVALPRLGALQTLVDTLNTSPTSNGLSNGTKKSDDKIKWIIDMTIGYPQGEAVDMPGMMVGWWPPRKFSVHYRVYSINDVPISDSDQFTEWLYDRFQEKNGLLDDYYANRNTLDESDCQSRVLPRIKRRPVKLDIVGLIFYHAFYAASTYMFCNYIYFPVLSVISWFFGFVF